MEIGDGEREERLTARFVRASEDFDDLQNEIAGRDVGRINRFIGEASANAPDSDRKSRDKRNYETNLQIMMASATYRALFEETAEILRDAQSRIETVLERIGALQAETEAAIEELEARAARLPDQSPVFRDKDGAVRRANGEPVDEVLAATILWRGDEPSYEDWRDLQDRAERLDALEADATAGQSRIGDMQARMDDQHGPPSTDELRSLKEDAEALASGLEEQLAAEVDRKPDAPELSTTTSTATVGVQFPEL